MLKQISNRFFKQPKKPNPLNFKTWSVSQEYELKHAITFMKEPKFTNLFKEHQAGKNLTSQGHRPNVILRDFFSCEDQDRQWNQFLERIRGRACLDLGPCVYSPLASFDTVGERIIIEPLFNSIDSWQKKNLGASVFEGFTTYSVGGECFIPELANKIDGLIYCRNVLDHTPHWPFVMSNISKYAKSGCVLLLWNDIDHRGTADEGHYDITSNPKDFRQLIEQLGFEIIRDFEMKDRPELNYGCYAIKR